MHEHEQEWNSEDRRSGEDRRDDSSRLPSVNWGAVMAVLTIVGWLIMAASGAFGDYRKIGDRVTVLETQRASDTQRQERNEQRLERIESKLDRALERK